MNKLMKFLVLAIIVCLCVVFYNQYSVKSIDYKKIVSDSVLRDKTFETNVVEIVSDKGIKAYLFEDKTNPIISIDFMFKDTGIAYDDGKHGMANLVSSLLTQGAGEFDNNKFKEELEVNAISISFDVGFDDFSGSLLTTRDSSLKAYELLKLSLTQPRFDDKEVVLVKQQLQYLLRNQKERPEQALALDFSRNIYGGHPYSENPIGDVKDIVAISKDDMHDYMKSRLTLDKLVVGIAGDISVEEAKKTLDIIFGDLPSDGVKKDIPYAEVEFDGRNVKIERTSAQNVAIFANQAVARTDIDFYPLYIANYIFGEPGLNSRLAMVARENEALTYGVYTYISNTPKSDLIKGSFSSTPDNYDRMIEIVKNEWAKMGKDGVTEEELAFTKNYLLSSYNLRFASISNISSMLVYMQRLNLGIDFLKKRNSYVEAVTLEDVNRVAYKYFDNDNMIFVSIGTFNKKEGLE